MGMEMKERLDSVVSRVRRFIERGEVSGVGLMVVHRDQVLLEWYGGSAAPGLAAGPTVLWPLAAVSKLYTAATVMALVERGILTLDLPLQFWLPEFEGDGRERVTIRHLLSHSSGVLYEPSNMETLLEQQLPLDELVEAAFTEPLLFPPGSGVAYSDLGYALLGLVAERATGESLARLMQELIFEPAILQESFFPLPANQAERLASVVGGLGEGTAWAMYGAAYGLRLAHPAWGVVATLRDAVRFLLHFTERAPGRLLSRATIAAMTTKQTGDAQGAAGWGLGWEVGGGFFGEATLFSPRSFGHTGATGCALWHDPTYELTFGLVSNHHLNLGRERFLFRMASILDGVIAAVT